jgi:hypothetical protein
MILLMFFSPFGNFFSTAETIACAFIAKSASSIVSSPNLHANDNELLTLTLIDDLNLCKNDSIGASNGTA